MKRFSAIILTVFIINYVQNSTSMNLKLRAPGSLTASQDSLKITYQNEEYFKGSVNVTNPGTVASATNCHFTLLKTPPANLLLKISPIREENGQFSADKVTPIKHNICQYIRRDRILYPGFVKYGNLPRSCPIKPAEYYIHNYKVPVEDLPPMVPPGKYKLVFDIANDEINLLKIEWVGSILLK